MGWIVAIVVLVLLVVSPGFRVAAVAIVALGLLAGAIFYAYHSVQTALATRRVPVTDVRFEEMLLGNPESGARLTGRVRNNNSDHVINNVELLITVQDCLTADPPDTCDTVGETTTTIFVDVPPGQVRDIERTVYFRPAPTIRGVFNWYYSLQSVTAE